MSRGQSQRKTDSRRRTLERCRAKGKADDVIVIDVDSDNICNFIIIDPPEPLQQISSGTRISGKDKTSLSGNIICIDDDESSDCESPRNGFKGCVNPYSDVSSSKGPQPSSSQSQNSVELEGEECQVVRQRKFSRKLSMCKVTYSGKNPSQNWHGLTSASSSSSGENDSPDCDLMEDYFGNIREQWEKALLRKKTSENLKGQSGSEDQVSTSGSNSDSQNNVEVENMADKTAEAPVPKRSSNTNDGKDKLATSTSTGDDIVGDTSLNPEGGNHFADLDQAIEQETPSLCKIRSWREPPISPRKASFQNSKEKNLGDGSFRNNKWKSNPHVNHGGDSFGNKGEQVFQGSDLHSTREQAERDFNCVEPCFHDIEENSSGESSLFGIQSVHGCPFDLRKANSQDEEASLFNNQHFDEMHVEYNNAGSWDKDDGICHEPSVYNTQSLNVSKCVAASFEERKKPSCNTRPCDDPPDVQNYIIGEREMLKKTDEYKRAAEEEWASRQQQLQIQAEAAQRLRKRKKAETMRLLDMERRQKERVEEMRQAQKKDEETINLKEQLRVEVRGELDKLEAKCGDMASLLRGLGILVRGGLFPLSCEVHAAYKQALLRFHPDRAARSDIRCQVEAEEKFKLISRAKEKLMTTS